ncbi:MAG TPA: bifunctional diguanylate cyclase/phosphodiesterase [Egibacteraceae bacterium]|nr:bifunctional diguanylate cyclase/phosphodiesterase [Egibacteraceae bacterium]
MTASPTRSLPARTDTNWVMLLTVAIALSAAALYLSVVHHLAPLPAPPGTPIIPWWVFIGAFAAAEMAVVHLHIRQRPQAFSLSEVPLVMGLFFVDPQLLVLARLLAAAPTLYFHARQRSVKLIFNIACLALETMVAILLFRAVLADASLAGGAARLAALVAVVGAGLLGTALILMVNTLHERLRAGATRWIVVAGTLTFIANASLGLVAVTVLQADVTGVWYLLVVTLIVFAAYRGYSTLHRRHEDLELLYEFTRAVGGALHVDSIGLRLLRRARDLLRAQHAELILSNADGSGEAIRLVLTADDQVDRVADTPAARRLRSEVAGDGAVAIARTTRDPHQRELLTECGFKDAVLVPLSAEDDLAGTAVVANRRGEVLTFGPEDARLLQTLANHAGVALANGHLVERLTHEVAEREHEALHDALTGLPNRTLFQRELAEVIGRSGAKAAVLLLDLNHFKDVNDTLGHKAGDLLLRDIGGRLHRALEGNGTVARLGGDEFAVLLPGVGGELAAKTVAHEVLGVVEQHATVEGVRVDIAASMGITLCPLHGRDATTLLRRADVAMYAAKESHAKFLIYDAGKDFHSPERLALASELRTTVDRGELRVVYQPRADLRTGRVVGVEALARWQHPERGFVPPDEFIAVAERSGLINDLTWHVLRTSLAQCRAWRLSGLPLGVSVNLSARSLIPELPGKVERILSETCVAASALTLEITESTIMADPENTRGVLDELSAMGVQLSIDDFGTGYSSLSYLRRLPVDEIKVDRSFVMGMSRDEGDAAIVRSTVDLGRNLGLQVVAEGIEDAETWTALATLGCDMAQGYYLSPPVTPPEFDRWLRSRTAGDGATPAAKPRPTVLPPTNPTEPTV